MKKKPFSAVLDNLSRCRESVYESPEILLSQLQDSIEGSNDDALLPLVPIRLVAIMEGTMQIQYGYIIDAEKVYRDNFVKFVKSFEKVIDIDVINSIEDNTISFGDYASMYLPCNCLMDIVKNVEALLGKKDLINIVANGPMIRDINEVFRYRHIFCHELASTITLKKEDVLRWIKSVSSFVDNVSNYIFKVLFAKSPVFGVDMIKSAEEDFIKADNKLKDMLYYLKSMLEESGGGTTFDYYDIFADYRQRRAEKEYQGFKDCSQYNIMVFEAMADITEEHIEGLRKKYRHCLRQYEIKK